MRTFTLTVQPGLLAICRLPSAAPVPPVPPDAHPLHAVTRTADELSIVCAEEDVPDGAIADGGWRALTLAGPFDLTTEAGVLVAVLTPLADAGVGIFAVSTYDTDHVLVRAGSLEVAVGALRGAGHEVVVG
ncbi:ACT domain-containing protein [Paraconexibacter antarcticus]|uniref:ACT domain-containing protein n=1 Tax=Paraconexibacter antarcticus TaxID=2949664 RepID=A0ABY5DUQ6_9ACTN|nr:ACT domain-containing protein [Paraconexibacter antarcticus]UTI65230.1 ACT domain-containing protein [Paraconexibacter antarcticus]